MEFDWTNVREREIETRVARGLKARKQFLMLNWRRDLEDIKVASKLRGKCLPMLLAIMHRLNLTKSDEVTLPTGYLAEFGIARSAKARALKSLETAKLIRVKRDAGHTAVVQLISRKRARNG